MNNFDKNKYVGRKKVLETLNIHYNTLYNITKRNEIEYITVGNKNYYNLTEYILRNKIENKKKIEVKKRKICYCRVSSNKQKEDLVRQVEYMKKRYPTYEIIKDIGSGLNYKRKGLLEIIEAGIRGEIEEVVITYKDRLTRFGYEIIEYIIEKYSNGKIKVETKEEEQTPQKEIVKDIMSIMNVYVAKINGLRKYKKIIKDKINKNM
jgi:predicted site-specific integrase-resolvase